MSGIAPAVTLEPGRFDYVVDLPLSQAVVTVTATLAPGARSLSIAGLPAGSGVPRELELSLGDNPVDIEVDNLLGWQRTYRMNLRRADQLAQYAFAKASNASSFFGSGVALSGDILAVAAKFEGSAAQGVDGDQDGEAALNAGAVYVFRRDVTA